MNNTSSCDHPDPFVPAVWSKPPTTPRDNLITFFSRMSYLAAIVIEVSIERDCSWQETMEAWQDGR